jgi:ankyrin repeat protein
MPSGRDIRLHRAAEAGDLAGCRRLLLECKSVAYVNSLDNYQLTALMFAADEGHTEICRLLLDAKADVNLQDETQPPLMLAAMHSHKDTCTLLMESGANVNARDRNQGTALIWAGCCDIGKLLLDAGADINASDVYKNTALIYASKCNRAELCRYLTCVPSCFIGATNIDGNTAASLCCTARFNVHPDPDLKRLLNTAMEQEKAQIHEMLGMMIGDAMREFTLPTFLKDRNVPADAVEYMSAFLDVFMIRYGALDPVSTIVEYAFPTISNEVGIAAKAMMADQQQ